MRARSTIILPLIAAAGMVMGGGDARAITIRYDFDPLSEAATGYTGGTIDVGSLDQTLGAAAVRFTVETGSGIITLVSNYAGGNTSNELLFSRLVSLAPLEFESWEAKSFNFGPVTDSTTWRQILSTNSGSYSASPGSFSWLSAAQVGGTMAPPPASITFSATDVPGPLPALGAAAAFGWSRRLRKRIQGSRQPVSLD